MLMFMKRCMAFLFFLFPVLAGAQQYRLSYDPSAIPELYHHAYIFLEEKEGNTYKEVSERYRIHAQQGEWHGKELYYTTNDLLHSDGLFHFIIEMGGEKFPLSLDMPVLNDLRFNLYTDSIKPILNFYVNVEGIFSSGRVLPLTEEQVTVTSDVGAMKGMEWIAPKEKNFDKVTFAAVSKQKPEITKAIIVYRKRGLDPRDAKGYEGSGRR